MSQSFASADLIARAFVAACKLTGNDPQDLEKAHAEYNLRRAQWTAFVALNKCLPANFNRAAIARGLGIPSPKSAKSNISRVTCSRSWRGDWVDEVVGAIMAPKIEDGPVAAPPPSAPVSRDWLPFGATASRNGVSLPRIPSLERGL